MGEDDDDFRVNQALGLMREFSPERIERLQAQFPSEAAVFATPGETLGKSDAKEDALIAVLSESLDASRDLAKTAFELQAASLRLAARLRVAALLLAAVTSASVVTLLIGQGAARTVAAVVAMASSVLNIMVSYFAGPEPEKRRDQIREIAMLEGRCESLLVRLRALRAGGTTLADLRQVSTEVEEIARRVRELARMLNLPEVPARGEGS